MYSEQDLKTYARDYERRVANLGQRQPLKFKTMLHLTFWLSVAALIMAVF